MATPMLGQPALNLPSVPPYSGSSDVVGAAGNASTGDQYGNAGGINIPYSGAKYNWATGAQSPVTGTNPNPVTPPPAPNVAAPPSAPAAPAYNDTSGSNPFAQSRAGLPDLFQQYGYDPSTMGAGVVDPASWFGGRKSDGVQSLQEGGAVNDPESDGDDDSGFEGESAGGDKGDIDSDQDDSGDMGGDSFEGRGEDTELVDAMNTVKDVYRYGAEMFGLIPPQQNRGAINAYQEGGEIPEASQDPGVEEPLREEEGPPAPPEPSQDPGVAKAIREEEGPPQPLQERGVPFINRMLEPIFTSGMSRDEQGALKMDPQSFDQTSSQEDPSADSIQRWKDTMGNAKDAILKWVQGVGASDQADVKAREDRIPELDPNKRKVMAVATTANTEGMKTAVRDDLAYKNRSNVFAADAVKLLNGGHLDESIKSANNMAENNVNGHRITFARYGDGVFATVEDLTKDAQPKTYNLTQDQYGKLLSSGHDPLRIQPSQTISNATRNIFPQDQAGQTTGQAPNASQAYNTRFPVDPSMMARGSSQSRPQVSGQASGRPLAPGQALPTDHPGGISLLTPPAAGPDAIRPGTWYPPPPSKAPAGQPSSQWDPVPPHLKAQGVTQNQWDQTRGRYGTIFQGKREDAAMKMRDAEVRTDLQRQKILGPQESKRLDREQKGEVERQKEEGRMQRSQQSAIGKERHSLRQSGVPEKDLPKAVEKYYPAQAPQTQPLTTLPTGQKARMITLPNGQKAYVTQ